MMKNDALLDALGYTIDEVIGKDFLLFIPTREHDKLLKRFEDLSKHHKLASGENYLLTKDGHEILAEWHNRLIFDKNGELDFVFGFGADITERRAAEETLRQNEKKFRSLYEGSRDAIARSDMDGRILDTNKAFQELTGYSAQELSRMTYQDMTPKKWHKVEFEVVKASLTGATCHYLKKST